MRVVLLTGPGGDAQGWGDLKVTEEVARAAEASGHEPRIVWVQSEADFRRCLDGAPFDILWSALYHVSANERFIGRSEDGFWVADVLDERQLPYIGSDSRCLRDMIDKSATHRILAAAGVSVPGNRVVRGDTDLSGIGYPAFVKPIGESRSVGISDDSVVESEPELRRQVAFIEREFDQPALVEEFLPGPEYTVLVLGNDGGREVLPGSVSVEAKHYGRHRILRADLRGVGLTRVGPAGQEQEALREIAGRAAEAMGCRDHVRVDVKAGADARLRIIEVNGIPGLKPHKSWACQLFTLHHASPAGEGEDYRRLIARIIASAARRYGLPGAGAGAGADGDSPGA
jgi:D-alanine-D-alanine ligase